MASGVNPRRCTWRSSTGTRRKSRSSAWIAPIASIPRSASTTRRRFDWSAPSTTCSDYRRKTCPTPAPGSITTVGVYAFRLGDRIDALSTTAPYRFLPAEGDGLHQIAVGPVHAGIIEPGHFRFTASGETVVRLEQRLGYTHKGIEGLMRGASVERGAAARRTRIGRQHRRLCLCFFAGRRSGAATCGAGRARSGCGRCLRNSNGLPIISATSARSATTRPSA